MIVSEMTFNQFLLSASHHYCFVDLTAVLELNTKQPAYNILINE